MSKTYNLAYYVYIRNINSNKIEKYNVLTNNIISEIKERTNMVSCDKTLFETEVSNILRYYYWARCEWEIVLTDWPTHISIKELTRLNNELEKHKANRGSLPNFMCVNLCTEEKIDVYNQLMLNWDIFIDYLWRNLR